LEARGTSGAGLEARGTPAVLCRTHAQACVAVTERAGEGTNANKRPPPRGKRRRKHLGQAAWIELDREPQASAKRLMINAIHVLSFRNRRSGLGKTLHWATRSTYFIGHAENVYAKTGKKPWEGGVLSCSGAYRGDCWAWTLIARSTGPGKAGGASKTERTQAGACARA
jgi:hypothetical protein